MKTLVAAVAFAIALPSAAHAQAAQAPAKVAQAKEMCACCKGMVGMSGFGHGPGRAQNQQSMGTGHAGHDMSQQGGKAPPADPHQDETR